MRDHGTLSLEPREALFVFKLWARIYAWALECQGYRTSGVLNTGDSVYRYVVKWKE